MSREILTVADASKLREGDVCDLVAVDVSGGGGMLASPVRIRTIHRVQWHRRKMAAWLRQCSRRLDPSRLLHNLETGVVLALAVPAPWRQELARRLRWWADRLEPRVTDIEVEVEP